MSFDRHPNLKKLRKDLPRLAPQRPDVEALEELFARGAQNVNSRDIAEMEPLHAPIRCEAVYLSDSHFGTPFCRSRDLFGFLGHVAPNSIYLNGDIIESWRVGYNILKLYRADPFQAACLLKINEFARQDVKITRTIGNHDRETSANEHELPVNGMTIKPEATHDTGDGKRILVLHGNQFDGAVLGHPWLSILGSSACEAIGDFSVQIDKWRADATINRAFKRLGFRKHWSLEKALQNAYQKTSYKDIFKRAALNHLFAINAGIFAKNKMGISPPENFFNGITCGHTHIPHLEQVVSPRDGNGNTVGPEKVTYSNTGCWTGLFGNIERSRTRYRDRAPTNTAIIEYRDGRTEHVQWIRDVGIVRMHLRRDGSFRGPASRKEARLMSALEPV